MKLKDAMTLRDGGTTAIAVETDGEIASYTFDYSLPWDSRPRFITSGRKMFDTDDARRLDLGGREERELYQNLRFVLEERFGPEIICQFVASKDMKDRPKAEGKWFYALNFLWLMEKERRLPRSDCKSE
jgi:hypothetical protein